MKHIARDNEFYKKYWELEKRYWWFVARRKILISIVKNDIAWKIGTNPRILDLGCGPGVNLNSWKGLGNVFGMDVSFEAATLAREETNCGIVAGNAEYLPFKADSFDLIFILDIIEHLNRPAFCLEEIRRVAKTDGLIVMTVPAYQALYTPAIDQDHKKRYRALEIKKLVKESGFEICKLTYYNTLLFPLMVFQRFLLRLKKGAAKEDLNAACPAIPDFLNTFLNFIFGIERFILKYMNLPFGGSVLCTFRKG